MRYNVIILLFILIVILGLPKINYYSNFDVEDAVSKWAILNSRLYSQDAKVKLKFSAYVLHIISQYEPRMHNLSNSWSHLQGLPLADNFEFPPDEVDILLGADVYPYILLDGLIKGAPGTPIAQNTIFGWTLTGPISMGKNFTTPILLSSHVIVKCDKSAVFVKSQF